jgi:glycolate oxidase iron-sulfur subunit
LSPAARGRVGLFAGCATSVQQGGALQDALSLLRAIGFAVEIPADAGCCGALAIHHGDRPEAQRLAARNRAAFDSGLDAVVSIASGCGVQLDDYAPALPARHLDICRFLAESDALDAVHFRPLPARVLLHTPCTVENVYRGARWARDLLSRIPAIEILDAAEAGQCCGSAGDYMLRHPETAARLRRPIVDQAKASGATILATSNVGCALHIAEGLGAEAGVEVLHPVQLLARQLVRPEG